MEVLNKKNNTRELSAILDADSFFYGLFQDDRLVRIGSKELSLINQFEEHPVNVKVAVRSDIFTHVPVAAFNKTRKEEYLSFSKKFSALKKPYVSYDILSNDLVTIWAMESSRKKMLATVSKHLLHLSTALIDYIRSFKMDGVYVHFMNASFEVIVIKNGQLTLYSQYDYYLLTDLLYFVRLTFENVGLKPKSDKLFLMGAISYQDDRYNILSEYFSNIDFLDLVDEVKRRNSHKNASLHACHQCGS